MGRCDTPKESIENLLHVRQMHFPEQLIDWDYLLDKFAQPSSVSISGAPFQERMKFLFMCGLSARVEALTFRVWRDCISNMIHTADFNWGRDNLDVLREIREKLTYFENKFPKIEEATTILELTLWKIKMNEVIQEEKMIRYQKKMKADESSYRRQCRITCGVGVIIRHVLPFLISTGNDDVLLL